MDPLSPAERKALLDPLLDTATPVHELVRITELLRVQLAAVTGIRGAEDFDRYGDNVVLPTGVAISPSHAAQCVRDFARTVQFMRGVRAAVREARTRFGAPVQLLYAGPGPFAPLVLPLFNEFAPEELRITLLDIQAPSLEMCRHAVAHFGGTPFIERWVQEDAAEYRHEAPLHIVVTETMRAALGHEPQVAITRNLARQLVEGGVLVPERIAVSLELADTGAEFARMLEGADMTGEAPVRTLATLFEVTAEGARAWPAGERLPAAELTLPVEPFGNRALRLATRITTFGEHRLEPRDSGLTCPLGYQRAGLGPGQRARFHYQIGARPGLVCVTEPSV